MQTVARSQYLTIKTEGAILPADLLQRLAEGKLDGLKPEQYHLSPNERLNEAITRAWNRCQGVWQSFQEQRQKLAPSESGTSLTRERWLLILFQELGYGRLTFQAGGLEIQPKTDQPTLTPATRYPISHVWEHVPIHLITFHQELDKRDPASKRSPHSLMQEFLTRSEDHLWGMVSNGLTLRVLRDNVSLTRAAYLEFDLEAMMSGDNYADFSLLWLVCHQSRMEIGSDPDAAALTSNCWLEIWSQEAAEQGTRALETLRDGVREAISALGRGFLAHPANTALRQLVGAENFYAGISAHEAQLAATVLQILREGPAPSASVKRIDEADVVLVLGEDLLASAPRLALAVRQAARGRLASACAEKKVPAWQAASAKDKRMHSAMVARLGWVTCMPSVLLP